MRPTQTTTVQFVLESDDRLLDKAAVAEMLGVSASTILRRLQAGELPRPVYRNDRLIQWRNADLMLWLALECPGVERFEQLRAMRIEQINSAFLRELRSAVRDRLVHVSEIEDSENAD